MLYKEAAVVTQSEDCLGKGKGCVCVWGGDIFKGNTEKRMLNKLW